MEPWMIIIPVVLVVLLVLSATGTRGKKPKTDEMTGEEFEHYCALILEGRGFRAITSTPVTGDYGADLVAYDEDHCKWVFQCKRYQQKVGNSAVQEIVAAKAHYDADYAAVMTNSVLTDNARRLAEENEVVVMEEIE